MIKANVILDYYKWKNKIKDPDNYLKKTSKIIKNSLLSKKKTRIFNTFNKQ